MKETSNVERSTSNVEVREAVIYLDSWGGRLKQEIAVVGETRTRYRIRADKQIHLAGRNRVLNPGDMALVPKHAVVFPEAA